MATTTAPTLADIEAARERVEGHARVTPVYGSETFSRLAGARVWLKAENLQRTGSFKIRGAVNKISTLEPAQRDAGVIAATVFMPQDAPMAKVEATRNYGADTVLTGAMFDDALAPALTRAEETGATFVLPIGGGGLAAGIATALRAVRPGVRIVGVQAGKTGTGTIADGIAVKHPGVLTMSILHELLDDIVHVEDDTIAEAITLLLERSKLVAEGAGAASLAAVIAGKAGGEDVCALLSGGNIDPTLLVAVVRHELTRGGRYLVFRSRVPDRPGELVKLLELVAAERGNILEIHHRREGVGLDVAETGVELTVVTRDEEHCLDLITVLESRGYPVERLS